ncbi:hypothetical protein [Caballeronia sordidicola]|uniref:hypothetical protein n=1 Tax=Caballeronia TaxID=1827195 RepID=UPI0012FE3350|nr:hypothetical protein [Caballeronia sordidicola]
MLKQVELEMRAVKFRVPWHVDACDQLDHIRALRGRLGGAKRLNTIAGIRENGKARHAGTQQAFVQAQRLTRVRERIFTCAVGTGSRLHIDKYQRTRKNFHWFVVQIVIREFVADLNRAVLSGTLYKHRGRYEYLVSAKMPDR